MLVYRYTSLQLVSSTHVYWLKLLKTINSVCRDILNLWRTNPHQMGLFSLWMCTYWFCVEISFSTFTVSILSILCSEGLLWFTTVHCLPRTTTVQQDKQLNEWCHTFIFYEQMRASVVVFKLSTFVGSVWSFWFVHPRHNGQWPPTSKEFYTRSYPLHYCLILFLERERVCWVLNKGTTGTIFMTRSLTGDWTRGLQHSKPALYY